MSDTFTPVCNVAGLALWWHDCGNVYGSAEPPTFECPWHTCGTPFGAWRPLFVGGDPAPEAKDSCHCESYDCNAVLAQVMAELDLTDPADVLITIQKRAAAFRRVCDSADLRKQQRDEARAEVGRLKAFMAADMGAGWLKLFLTRYDADQPAQSDPLVLSLPEVPEGAALLGLKTGQRFTVDPEASGRAVWTNGSLSRWTLANLLDQERPEGVRVELAPSPEARTWPQLQPPPLGVARVRVAGRVFTSVDGVYWDEEYPGDAEYAWPMLLALGDVEEITES